MLYKLISNRIDGKFYNSRKSKLSHTTSYVKLNGILTDRFPVLFGLRQGDSSSQTIFTFYINDLQLFVMSNYDVVWVFFFCLVLAMSLCPSVYMCFVVTCWERTDLLALVCGV